MSDNQPTPTERVLCIPAADLSRHGNFQGLLRLNNSEEFLWHLRNNNLFIARPDAELNENYKQLLPYVTIISNQGVLTYERSTSGGEQRLHSKLSVGLGGHINPEDGPNSEEAFFTGTARELMEEVGITVDPTALKRAPYALLNDDSNPVGRVHLGVAMIIHINDDNAQRILQNAEHTIKNPAYIPLDHFENKETFERLESWSQFIVSHLLKEKQAGEKYHDKGFRERVGMLAVCASNLASVAAGMLLEEDGQDIEETAAMIEEAGAQVSVMISGLVSNNDISKEAVAAKAKAFYERLPSILKHQS